MHCLVQQIITLDIKTNRVDPGGEVYAYDWDVFGRQGKL